MHNTQPHAEQAPITRNRVDGSDHRVVLQVGAVYGDITFCTAHPSTAQPRTAPPRAARPTPAPSPAGVVRSPAPRDRRVAAIDAGLADRLFTGPEGAVMTSTSGTRPRPGRGRQGERVRAGGVGVHDLIAQIELVTRLWSGADVRDQATVEPVMTAFARLSMMVHDLGRDPAAERSVPMDLPELRAATNQLLADFTAWLDDRGRRRSGAGREGGC